jgi:hypothetical protein
MGEIPDELFNVDPGAFVEGLFEWSNAEFGQPINFGLFDKRILKTYDSLRDEILNNPERGVREEDLQRYIDWGLFPSLYLEDGSRGFPLYAPWRAYFVHNLVAKWGYDPKKLKIIIDDEESLIDIVFASDYSDLPPLDFYLEYLEGYIENHRPMLSIQSKTISGGYRDQLKKTLDSYQATVDFLKKTSFEDLSDDGKRKLEQEIFRLNLVNEFSCVEMYKDRHAQILIGCSPDVFFKRSARHWVNHPMPDFLKTEEYPYLYQDGDDLYVFGDWNYHACRYDFFSTPEFIIELSNGKIILEIRDPKRVDSKFMRKIDKIYSIFRQKLDPPKAGWGEKKGTKSLIEKRDRMLRQIYQQLRKEAPMASADGHLRKAMQVIFSEYGAISFETARRVVYSGKSDARKS